MMAPAKLAAAAAAFAWPGSWVATIIMPNDPSTVTIEPYVDSKILVVDQLLTSTVD